MLLARSFLVSTVFIGLIMPKGVVRMVSNAQDVMGSSLKTTWLFINVLNGQRYKMEKIAFSSLKTQE